MDEETVQAMRKSIDRQDEMVRAQKRILALLKPFDDETGRRIIGSAAVLLGAAEAVVANVE